MKTFNETKQMVDNFKETVDKEREKIKSKKDKLIKQRNDVNEKIKELSEQYLKADIEDQAQEMTKIDKMIQTEQDKEKALNYKITSYENAIKDKSRHEKQAIKVIKVAQKEIEEVEKYRAAQRKLAAKLEEEIKQKKLELEKINITRDTNSITNRIGAAVWRIKEYLFKYDDKDIRMVSGYMQTEMVKNYDPNEPGTHQVG